MCGSGLEESYGELGVEGGGWFISTALRCNAKESTLVFVCSPLLGSFGAEFARMKGATRREKESDKGRNDGDLFLDTLGFNKKTPDLLTLQLGWCRVAESFPRNTTQ